MLLAIDVGNTNMVFGIYDKEKLCGSFRISTNAERSITIFTVSTVIRPTRSSLRAWFRP